MNKSLITSILLNAILLGSLSLILYRQRNTGYQSAGSLFSNQQALANSSDSGFPTNASFLWSRIESPDYRVYVANLRSIGCPEDTIRDIITADIGALYSAKRQQLGQKGSNDGHWSRDEEQRLVSFLIGRSTGSEVPLAETQHTEPATCNLQPATTSRPAMPLVFQNVNLAELHLDSGRIKAIEELRQRFIELTGGPGQDTNDPAYRQRWLETQPENDELLRGMIGVSAFQNYQLEAAGAHLEDTGEY
jgi:hypothetical protein